LPKPAKKEADYKNSGSYPKYLYFTDTIAGFQKVSRMRMDLLNL
jgi:hypothetical protein